jgi:hypothetical protein
MQLNKFDNFIATNSSCPIGNGIKGKIPAEIECGDCWANLKKDYFTLASLAKGIQSTHLIVN